MYWTREIITFFGIKEADIKTFLNFHQVYKLTYMQKLQQEGRRSLSSHQTGRAGSYWNPNYINDANSSDPRFSEKSFHVNIGKFEIKEDYIYAGSRHMSGGSNRSNGLSFNNGIESNEIQEFRRNSKQRRLTGDEKKKLQRP